MTLVKVKSRTPGVNAASLWSVRSVRREPSCKEQGCALRYAILMHFCGCFYLCCQDTYSNNSIPSLKGKKKKRKRKKRKKKISTEAPAYAICCCQDFNSHEADADSECHSSLDGVTLGSPVKEKNQTDFKTATALCPVGRCRWSCVLE